MCHWSIVIHPSGYIPGEEDRQQQTSDRKHAGIAGDSDQLESKIAEHRSKNADHAKCTAQNESYPDCGLDPAKASSRLLCLLSSVCVYLEIGAHPAGRSKAAG
jgi:hypothetical protein